MFSLGTVTYQGGTFKFQIEIVAGALTFILPIAGGGATYKSNFTVSWGDGNTSEITAYDDADRTHTYAGIGTYDVEMSGVCQYFCFTDATVADRNKMKKLLEFTGDIGFKVLDFYSCANLNTIVSLGTLRSLVTASNIFARLPALTSIPVGLFDGCPAITNLANAFELCNNVALTTIPADLFKYNPLNASFNAVFSQCTYLTSIPADLFKYNTLVGNFVQAFYYCSNITSIPADLFKYNVACTTFNITFQYTGVSSIPTDLFRYNTLVNNFTGTFKNTNLTTVPTDTFRYNTAVLNFAETFSGCTVLTTIPDDLFRYNTLVTSFSECFSTCSSLTAVPTDLFRYNTLVTNMSYAFNACSSLTTVPTDTFRYNTLVNSFARLFSVCSALASIPTDIFRYNTAVTSFAYCFNACSSLTTVPADLFKYNTAVTTFAQALTACTKLQLNKNIFYADGEQGTRFLNKTVSFSICFSRASFTGTQGVAPDLWNCNFGTGTPTKTNCYGGAGNSLTSLSNYADIPVAWRT